MPIPGLRDEQNLSFPKIGDIRKGAKKLENGQVGPDLTYFRYVPVTGEELAEARFHEVYGDEPRAINVLLPFDEIGRNFETFMERHTAGALQCRGDIEGGKCIMWRDKATGKMQHTPKDCPAPICKGCKETGRLKIIIPELQRLGYVTVHTTSIWDIIELTRNLGALRKLTGNGLKGIPLVLKRRPRSISTPWKSGKRARREKWLLSIEADQRWVKAQLTAMEVAALPAVDYARIGPPTPDPEEAGEWVYINEETGEIVDEQWKPAEAEAPSLPAKEPEPESQATIPNGSRPYSPAQTRLRLRNNGGWTKGKAEDFSDAHRPPDDQQEPPDKRLVQRVAALMGKALARPDSGEIDFERHLVLHWNFGVERTGLLTEKEAIATAKWLETPAGEDGKSAWIPSGVASDECKMVLEAAQKEVDGND